MKVEVVAKESEFVVGGVYEDSEGDYYLLTKMPDDSGYVWVNLTKSESSSVVDERTTRNIAGGTDYIPGAVLHIPKEAN